MFEDGYCISFGRGPGVCFGSCSADEDCPLYYSCSDEDRCEFYECGRDEDCGEGQLCRRTEQQNAGFCTSAPFEGCAEDDSFEANDTDSAAATLEDTEVDGLLICDGNDDFFFFEVAEVGTELEVNVAFDGRVDIDVYIYDAAGRTVGAATEPDANPESAVAGYLDAGRYTIRVNQFPSEVDQLTEYGISIETGSASCTVEGGECLDLFPLRIACDEEGGGVCRFLEGEGEVALGDPCDSSDDCVDEADFCWSYEPADEGRNICTRTCGDGDCSDVPGTECQPFGRNFAVCLP